MIAEGSSHTPGGEPPRRSERDLLAERRALRAAQEGDPALLRRAEAAEATVQTLETHLSSLRHRLTEAEESARHSAQRLSASENELRRVKQQEYAEQQLRVEAERALLDAADRSAGALARSEVVQRLQARVAEVELRAAHLAREIESERRARERTERELEAMRESHAAMAVTVSELRDVARKLREAAASSPSRSPGAARIPTRICAGPAGGSGAGAEPGASRGDGRRAGGRRGAPARPRGGATPADARARAGARGRSRLRAREHERGFTARPRAERRRAARGRAQAAQAQHVADRPHTVRPQTPS